MGKITFRADDDLVERLDGFDASKSQVMREALRAYLDGPGRDGADAAGADGDALAGSHVDGAIRERVDARVAERLDELGFRLADGPGRDDTPGGPRVSLTVNVDGASDAVSLPPSSDEGEVSDGAARPDDTEGVAADGTAGDCAQCGEPLSDDHVYCPNCGEKASRRLFCDCGDEVRSDWAFCPGCGRRTPAADVLDGA